MQWIRFMPTDIFQWLLGGTGFYIQALLYDIDFTGTAQDDTYRAQRKEDRGL